MVGVMYYSGEGVRQDYVKSFEWCEKAALQGHVWGQYNIADAYYKGIGVNRITMRPFIGI